MSDTATLAPTPTIRPVDLAKQALERREAEKRGPGQPRALVFDRQTLATVGACAQRQMGIVKTAAFLGVAANTLRSFFTEYPEARELFELAKQQGLGMLSGKQYETAMGGNAQLLIWLGRQHLGQRDEQYHRFEPDLSRLSDDELIEYERLNAKAAGLDAFDGVTIEYGGEASDSPGPSLEGAGGDRLPAAAE